MIERGPWLFPLLALVPAAALLAVRHVGAPAGLGLVDAGSFSRAARRTTVLAAGLAALAALLVAFAASVVRQPTTSVSALLSSEQSTVIVLDMSASVSDLVYDEIARTLTLISRTPDDSVRVGLVLFSDVAQVALPPGTRPRELEPFIRFFLPKSEASARDRPSFYRPAGPAAPAPISYIFSPWFVNFSSGTAISSGLVAAREAIAQTGQSGRVLLISDLDNTAADAAPLSRELSAYAREGTSLEVVAVPPAVPAQREKIERALQEDVVVDSGSLREEQGSFEVRGPGLPAGFVVLVVAVALILAIREPLAAPVDLGADAPRKRGAA